MERRGGRGVVLTVSAIAMRLTSMFRNALCLLTILALTLGSVPAADASQPRLERVSTAAPFPRGLVMLDGELYVLCRGRVRSSGGVSAEVEDQAGTIYAMNPHVTEPAEAPVGDAVRTNGRVVALPTDPPFRLWDRASVPAESDTRTDRPYCVLRYHEPTKSFYLCAFSGIDKRSSAADPVAFSKNTSDAILRYDTRTKKWSEVERHAAGSSEYPSSDTPPRGLLKGPDNCLPLGRWLYAVAKDNSLLARYDLSAWETDPDAPPAAGQVVMGAEVEVAGLGTQTFEGQSGLAYHGGFLYIAYRTSSVIVRIPLDAEFSPVQPIRAELVARFDPYDPVTRHSADLTDLTFDERGRLYAVSAQPARVYRFTPDPAQPFDGRTGSGAQPWLDLAAATGNDRMKSENVLAAEGYLYVTSGDGYSYQKGADGTVYRARIAD